MCVPSHFYRKQHISHVFYLQPLAPNLRLSAPLPWRKRAPSDFALHDSFPKELSHSQEGVWSEWWSTEKMSEQIICFVCASIPCFWMTGQHLSLGLLSWRGIISFFQMYSRKGSILSRCDQGVPTPWPLAWNVYVTLSPTLSLPDFAPHHWLPPLHSTSFSFPQFTSPNLTSATLSPSNCA